MKNVDLITELKKEYKEEIKIESGKLIDNLKYDHLYNFLKENKKLNEKYNQLLEKQLEDEKHLIKYLEENKIRNQLNDEEINNIIANTDLKLEEIEDLIGVN